MAPADDLDAPAAEPRWARAEDVRVRWLSGVLSVDDEQIDVLLEDVEDFLLGEYKDLPERIEDGRLTEKRLTRVIVRIAMRVLRNPDGYRQVTSGTGPFTGSATYGGDQPGEVYVTDEDRKDLVGRGKGRRIKAFSVFPGGRR